MATIKKNELLEKVKSKVPHGTKVEGDKYLKAICESIVEFLDNGDSVRIVGFGTFEQKCLNERKGLDPKTKEVVTRRPVRTIKFLPSKGLRRWGDDI